MAEKSEVFSAAESTVSAGGKVESQGRSSAQVEAHFRRDFVEIAIVFACIMIAIWTPPGKVNSIFSLIASASVVAFAITGRWGARELGLTRPWAGAGPTLLTGAILCGLIALIGLPLRFAGAGWGVPLARSWQYGIWALQQEFILQSIFFLRLEPMVGSRRAVFAAATLFAVAHIPSPVLIVLAFAGGVVFCELFRRGRNLYPLGIIHAALGLTIAASLPDHWLHHMRVGIGYVIWHS
jgi:membrane protease YdiL (CAAX protease family)